MTKTKQHIRLIFPHQIFTEHFKAPKNTTMILIEDDLFFTQYRFHVQKLILHRATFLYFHDALAEQGFTVVHLKTSNVPSMERLSDELKKYSGADVSYFELSDDWLQKRLQKVLSTTGHEVSRLESPGFLTSQGMIEEYFDTKPNRMQAFYEWQRKRLNILIEDNKPVGGKWSYDESNRKKLPNNITLPRAYAAVDSPFISEATRWVKNNFGNNPGNPDTFIYPITHSDAEKRLHQFLKERFAEFGPFEDAISKDENELFHSVLSPLINIGLLAPKQVIDAALDYANSHEIPLQSLEGFIRQIIGWREYMRATYLRYGSEMRTTNHFNFTKHIALSWWDGSVGIEPVDTTIKKVLDTAYAHHIERLMILGNILVLLRVRPDDVYEWFMALFIDAYDWVMVPNVYAMSQFAAGDKITTKPYVSGSNYIIKMSDYKKDEWAEAWDALYWQFVHDYRDTISKNYRSSVMVKLYDRMSDEKKNHHADVADKWL